MITNFKLFENQTDILNDLLDKIQLKGKDSLTPNELNFLNEYPNGTLEQEEEIIQNDSDFTYVEKPGLSSYSTENFWFEMNGSDIDEISNTFIISGNMLFMVENHERIGIEGYFVVNQETHQIFPYFNGPDGETAFDYTFGHEDEFFDFMESIYEKNKKEKL